MSRSPYNSANCNQYLVETFESVPKVVTEDKVFKVGQLVLDRKCPHQGCKLNYNKTKKMFICPCHNSKFNMRGNCISGPACPSDIRI